jgi:prophage regulatory protein
MSAESLLTRAEVERRTGFKRTAIYARIAAGTFPPARKDPVTGSVRWLESEVQAWIDNAARTWEPVGKVVGRRAA